jgi:hypothetical protein
MQPEEYLDPENEGGNPASSCRIKGTPIFGYLTLAPIPSIDDC